MSLVAIFDPALPESDEWMALVRKLAAMHAAAYSTALPPGLSDAGETALVLRSAASIGLVPVVEAIMHHPKISSDTLALSNCLAWAAEKGHIDIVRLLLADDRVDPSAKANYAITRASHYGHVDTVRLLLTDNRVDPSAKDNCAIRLASFTATPTLSASSSLTIVLIPPPKKQTSLVSFFARAPPCSTPSTAKRKRRTESFPTAAPPPVPDETASSPPPEKRARPLDAPVVEISSSPVAVATPAPGPPPAPADAIDLDATIDLDAVVPTSALPPHDGKEPAIEGDEPQPKLAPQWDLSQPCEAVLMPHSVSNTRASASGPAATQWSVMCRALAPANLPVTPHGFVALLSELRGVDDIDASAWLWFWDESASKDEAHRFFVDTLPRMAALALSLPALFPDPVPLLRRGEPGAVTLTQAQLACAMAVAAFGCWPYRNARRGSSARDLAAFPSFTFMHLYAAVRKPSVAGKFRCLIHYFEEACAAYSPDAPGANVTFARLVAHRETDWDDDETLLEAVTIDADALIEDVASADAGWDFVEVDFANRFVGGGVLGNGCIQEEVRFLIAPELIVSRLLAEALDDDEALLIVGAQRYSAHAGYGASFTFAGGYNDPAPLAANGHRTTAVFSDAAIARELRKASAGFAPHPALDASRPRAVVTGNWGCGAFGGDPELKFVLQWLAASTSGRSMVYCTFGDPAFAAAAAAMVDTVRAAATTVAGLYSLIREFAEVVSPPLSPAGTSKPRKKVPSLFKFLHFALRPPSP
ncbi:Poly(Adp-ribose) glycohydrolase [Thecamonas trahens ATCC 50062]|uniref:poly(ADP-ribose) glycohydrolase n=1 Tax=Thecamonas trahens ATCC 50062 TaxID=461836 RepID=A0A0L0DH56_THETB|nr:Poly(Adp-ribose) glycohydrolase [Thecamonas trahens ATCC 50062]KNC51642.1 Poly(Adp-ribose) glycohydrolase [Thecamonas trahens ATCC 50062]|eukprot:XP_013755782.1 Poly(Adp-ribose) glycohydrolase [Thecamonas trahens ATCC 50062]